MLSEAECGEREDVPERMVIEERRRRLSCEDLLERGGKIWPDAQGRPHSVGTVPGRGREALLLTRPLTSTGSSRERDRWD